MRKIKFLIIPILLLVLTIPNVSAVEVLREDDWEGYELVGETTKYFKTVTVYNNSVYSMNGYLNASNNATSTTTEITEFEYNLVDPNMNSLVINDSATVETTYKRMVTSIWTNGAYYRYKNVLSWKNMPAVRSYDITAIGFLGSVTPINYYFEEYYCETGIGCGYIYTSYPSLFSSGFSVIYPLVTSPYTLSTLKSTFYFDVQKTDPNSTVVYQLLYGDYAHATTPVSVLQASYHEVIQAAGIILDSSISSYYDSIPQAYVNYPCNW